MHKLLKLVGRLLNQSILSLPVNVISPAGLAEGRGGSLYQYRDTYCTLQDHTADCRY